MHEAAPSQDRTRALTLGAACALLYLCTAPSVVNPDGLGYLKLLPHNFAAGHLLYMPILRAATRLIGSSGLEAGRFVNAMLGGSAVLLLYGTTRRALSALPLGRPFSAGDVRFCATFAAAGLGVSYGVWIQGADVEAYAAALVALLSTVRLALAYRAHPTVLRALAVGVALGVAVLCHLSHVLLSLFVAGWLWSHAPAKRARLGHAALALTVGGALTLALYAYAAFGVRHHDLDGALRWIATAQHGFRYGGGPYKLADAVYGLAKALVWSPYLFESDAQVLLGQFLLGLLPLVALTVAVVLRRRALPPLEWRLYALWIAPYAALGVAFFGSDSERWVFVLPGLWLLAAVVVALGPRRTRVAVGVVAYLLVLNFSTGIWPQHRDWAGVRARAEATAHLTRAGDLLLFPGHSWDEYVSFYATAEVEPFPIVYYAARDGVTAMWARLEKERGLARARGGRVLSVRLFDDDEVDPRGWDELAALGLPRALLRAELRARFSPVTIAQAGADGSAPVTRLDDAAGTLVPPRAPP